MPIEQLGNSISFYGFYTNNGSRAAGLTVTIDVWEVQKDGTRTKIVTAANAIEIGDGFYFYILVSGSVDEEGEYLGVFNTAGSADQADMAANWSVARGGIENLDAAVSSRSPAATALTNVTWTDARAGYLDELEAGNMPSDLDDVLTDTGTTIPALIAALNDPTAAVIADAVHDEVIEGALTYRQITRIVLSVLSGLSSGGGTTSVAYRNLADDADRVTGTTNAVGDRTAVTLDGT